MRLLILCLLLCSCGETCKLDQDKRLEIFFKCLEKIPKGPDKTKYNDWSEVVQECFSVATYSAKICK